MGLRINGQNADIAVPSANATANITMADVIGSKLDDESGDSLYAMIEALHDLATAPRLVYPTLAVGANVVSAAGVWTLGNYATIVPANAVAYNFQVRRVAIESCTVANGIFQLELYSGASDDPVTVLRFSVVGGFWGNSVYVCRSTLILANSQIRARLASDVGAATVGLSVGYSGLN